RLDGLVSEDDALTPFAILPGPMGSGVVQAQVKRFAPAPVDVIDCSIGQQIRQVSLSLYRCEVLVEVGLSQSVFVNMVIGGAGENSEKLVKAVCVRTPLGAKAEVPFADERRLVAVRLEQRSDRWFAGLETDKM